MTYTTLPTTPARRATRYVVYLGDGSNFTVLVLRGQIPRERINSMLARYDAVIRIEVEYPL